jgi:hypothetical protein
VAVLGAGSGVADQSAPTGSVVAVLGAGSGVADQSSPHRAGSVVAVLGGGSGVAADQADATIARTPPSVRLQVTGGGDGIERNAAKCKESSISDELVADNR